MQIAALYDPTIFRGIAFAIGIAIFFATVTPDPHALDEGGEQSGEEDGAGTTINLHREAH